MEPRNIVTLRPLHYLTGGAGDFLCHKSIDQRGSFSKKEMEENSMNMTELKERTTQLMEENVTLNKLNFILLGAVMLLAGICLGLLAAPITHGITVGSHNGCNNGNNNGNDSGNNHKVNQQDEA